MKTSTPFKSTLREYPWAWLIFFGIYLLFFFPFSYFRHDDWMHLGNSNVFLPRDWSFAFRPTQFIFESEEIWFFRPLVKFLAFLNYQLFSTEHYAWISLHLLLSIASLILGAKAVEQLTQSSYRARIFILLFLANFQLHVGSILWVGEGIMNCPQVFALSCTLYYFVRAGWINQLIALAFFIVSLGFKESSCFFPVFLLATSLRTLWKDWGKLLPHFCVAAIYLYFRLMTMPLHQGYFNHWTFHSVVWTSALLVGALFFSISALIWFNRKCLTRATLRYSALSGVLYFAFFALILTPYIGHEFFSPGWLFMPGFFFCLSAPLWLEFPLDAPNSLKRAFVASLVVSLAVVLWEMQQLDWFEWKKQQTKAHAIVSVLARANIDEIHILSCPGKKPDQTRLDRVVGFQSSFYQMWKLYSTKPVQITFRSCDDYPKPYPLSRAVVLRSEFPDLYLVP